MEELIIKIAVIETKVNMLMFINSIFAGGVITVLIHKIFRNGKKNG